MKNNCQNNEERISFHLKTSGGSNYVEIKDAKPAIDSLKEHLNNLWKESAKTFNPSSRKKQSITRT